MMASQYVANRRRFQEPDADDALYAVLHMPKTAGKTLEATLRRNFRGRQWLDLNAAPVGIDKDIGLSTPGWDLPRIQRYVRGHLNVETRCVMGHLVYVGV